MGTVSESLGRQQEKGAGTQQTPRQWAMSMLMKPTGKRGASRRGYQGQSNNQGKRDSQSSSQSGGCYDCGKAGHIPRNCPNSGVEARVCNRCGMKGRLASRCKVNVREVAEEQEEAVIWGASVIDEVQDVDVAGNP